MSETYEELQARVKAAMERKHEMSPEELIALAEELREAGRREYAHADELDEYLKQRRHLQAVTDDFHNRPRLLTAPKKEA